MSPVVGQPPRSHFTCDNYSFATPGMGYVTTYFPHWWFTLAAFGAERFGGSARAQGRTPTKAVVNRSDRSGASAGSTRLPWQRSA
jgi:hypothetical protein